jgi:hypothetical protein
MKPLKNQKLLPFFLIAWLTAQAAIGQTPAPARNKMFQLPLSDGTTANAVVIPTIEGNASLVYATAKGELVIYYLMKNEVNPEPKPNPPPPPIPQKLTIAIVEDVTKTTDDQLRVLSSLEWRNLAADNHNFLGIIPQGVIDKKTGKVPAKLDPFLKRSEGHVLPWLMFAGANGSILFEATLPQTSAEIISLIHKYGG